MGLWTRGPWNLLVVVLTVLKVTSITWMWFINIKFNYYVALEIICWYKSNLTHYRSWSHLSNWVDKVLSLVISIHVITLCRNQFRWWSIGTGSGLHLFWLSIISKTFYFRSQSSLSTCQISILSLFCFFPFGLFTVLVAFEWIFPLLHIKH